MAPWCQTAARSADCGLLQPDGRLPWCAPTNPGPRTPGRSTLVGTTEWLRRWPSTHLVVEGHCDEHGTPEYNIALGARRAQAVKAYLISLGVGEDRVDAISRGKETPDCTASTESCWQQNRRGYPVITAK